jgi:hypothetical protein
MKTKLLLAIFCGLAALAAMAYALAAHGSTKQTEPPAAAGIGAWQTIDAGSLGTAAIGAARLAGATGGTGGTQVAIARTTDGAYVGVLRDPTVGLRVSALANDPGSDMVSVHTFRPLTDVNLINDSLGLLTLTQTPAPDGTVGRIFGAGIVQANAIGAQLVALDGSVEQLPLVDLGAGARAFAFVADDAKRFPTAIQGVDAGGKVVAEFRFDPTSHP